MDIDAIQAQVAAFHRAYMTDPEFVDRQYEVPNLNSLLTRPGVVGVARFIEFPSFGPESLYTLVYRPASIEISAVIGASSLWCSVSNVYRVGNEWRRQEGEPFDPGQAWRRETLLELPSEECPALVCSWSSVRAVSLNAGSCSTDSFDGIVYRHRVLDQEFHSDADWYNPELPEHASQLALIAAYSDLLRHVGLYFD